MIFGMNFFGVGVNNQDVKVFRANKDSWGEKPGGGNKAVYSHTLENVALMPRTQQRTDGADGFQGRVAVGFSLFVGDEDDVAESDEFELVDVQGRLSRWKVDGSVDTDYSNPFSPFSPGREVQVKKIAGQK